MNEKRDMFEETSDGFTLLELFNAIKNNLLLLLAIVVVFFGLGIVYTYFIVTPMYTSSVSLQIHIEKGETTGTDAVKAVAVTQVANNIKEYIKFPDVIKPVVEEHYNETDPQKINRLIKMTASRISTAQIGSSSAVQISYEHEDPLVAAQIIIDLAEALVDRVNREPTEEGSLKFSTESIRIINRPLVDPNQRPSSPNIILNLSVSLILGMIAGVVIVILKEQFKNYYSSKKDVESTLHIPVLAIIAAVDKR